MIRVGAAFGGLSLALFVSPLNGQVQLPYETDFESASGYVVDTPPGLAPWAVGGSGAQVTTADYASDAQGVVFPQDVTGFLKGNFTSSQAGLVTYVDFYLKPAAGPLNELPETSSDVTAAMTGVVDEAGTGWLYVVHGDGLGGGMWQRIGPSFALTDGVSTNWIRLTYRLNYATKTWDLYLDDDLVAADLGFIDDVLESFNEFRLKGGGLAPVYFDFFYAGFDNPVFVDSDNDGMSDAYESANGLDPNADDRYSDHDFDGIANIHEFLYDLKAGDPDTDNDGVSDGWELAAGADPATPDAYVLSQLPYSEGFESHPGTGVTGAGGWAYEGGTEPQLSSADAASGTYSVLISPLSSGTGLYNVFTAEPDTIVWVDFAIKPGTLTEEPSLGTATSAGFYFGEDGRLCVFDGAEYPLGAWESLTHESVETGAWQRLTVQLNYTTQRWAVYLNGLRLAAGLGFANTVPYFQSFRVTESQGGETYLDDVQVGYTEPVDLDNDGDGLTNAWEIAHAAHGYHPDNAYSADPLHMVNDGHYDLDADGLGTLAELAAGTDIADADTDHDGILDGSEATLGEDPLVAGTFNTMSSDSAGVYTWAAGFESAEGYSAGPLNGQALWRSDAPEVTVTATYAQTGAQSLALEAAGAQSVSAEQWLASPAGAHVVWVGFQSRLSGGALPDLSERETLGAAYFTLDETGTLHVYDGTSAQWLTTTLEVDDAVWTRFDVRLDYVSKTWDIWVDGEEIAAEIAFANPALAGFARVRFEQLHASLGLYADPSPWEADARRHIFL